MGQTSTLAAAGYMDLYIHGRVGQRQGGGVEVEAGRGGRVVEMGERLSEFYYDFITHTFY